MKISNSVIKYNKARLAGGIFSLKSAFISSDVHIVNLTLEDNTASFYANDHLTLPKSLLLIVNNKSFSNNTLYANNFISGYLGDNNLGPGNYQVVMQILDNRGEIYKVATKNL